ncbi:membrane protein insertase YidC, partial [Patescibacteria group bacterium]|nr:membrane protein insertase YidC [Patescibacteria group bacterium]
MFDQLLYPFLNILTFFSWLIPGHNIALSITALTLLVRFILILPSKRAAQAQRKMAQLQPLIEELKTEYGDDKQGLAAAQMELYKKNNASPFGACLPLLIQIPLLLILYRTIYLGLTPNNPHIYSFVPRPDHIGTTLFGIDLLKPDIFYLGGIGIPAILPWLAAIVQYLQVRLTTAPTATTAKVAEGQFDPQAIQKQTALIIPIFTLVIARNFPAGVVVYWIVNTGFSVVQQYFV